MSAYEGSYKSLLQGVSQQLPSERPPGQVSAQENMLSDPVTNVRRRPGAEHVFHLTMPGATWENTRAWFTDIAGQRVHVLLCTATGQVLVLDEDFTELADLDGAPYLQASDPQSIQTATVGDEFFLCNTTVHPSTVPNIPTGANNSRGYVWVVAGAFSRTYTFTVNLTKNGVETSTTTTYTTPDGTTAGDAALATPEYIMEHLRSTLGNVGGRLTFVRDEAYMHLRSTDGSSITIVSSTGSQYMLTSRAQYARTIGELPAQLPSAGEGLIIAVGDASKPQYYRFQYSTLQWLESGAAGSPLELQDMPVSLTYADSTWGFVTEPFEGRFAGDSETNPDPAFLRNGITGMSAYQGRLVLLAGSLVCLSASSKPRRMYRSTVVSVLDSDAIEIGSSANSSAAYVYAKPFQKDLVLFSETYQALIPSGNTAISPRTATVVLTGTHEADIGAAPVDTGRTLLFPAPRSSDFFGVMEMLPSQYTDSQYLSTDITPHIPKYMGGKCRFAVCSSIAGIALFAPSGDPYSLIVHEYLWQGDQKVQQAWHRWTFPYEVAWAYFATDKVIVLFSQNDTLVACSLDPRAGSVTVDSERRPFTDMYVFAEIVQNEVAVPTWMLAFDPDIGGRLQLRAASGNLAGDVVGFALDGAVLRTVRSWPSGTVSLGIPFVSAIAPTQPVVRDRNEVQIHSNKVTVLRFLVSTRNSSEYMVSIQDRNNVDAPAFAQGTLLWSSSELALGRSRVASESVAVVPARTNALSTAMLLYTGPNSGELNVVALEYVLRTNQKIRRM